MQPSVLRSWRVPTLQIPINAFKDGLQLMKKDGVLSHVQRYVTTDLQTGAIPQSQAVSVRPSSAVNLRAPEYVYFWEKLKKCFGFGSKKGKSKSDKKKQTCKSGKGKCNKNQKNSACLKKTDSKISGVKAEEKTKTDCKPNGEKKSGKSDICKKDATKTDISKKEVKKADPCKNKEEKKDDPCKKKEEKKKDDSCMKREVKKIDPCKKKKENKEDPCKKTYEKKKNDPCRKKEEKKKEDPCKKEVEKKEDPCKKKDEKNKSDPCKKKGEKKSEDPYKKKEDEKGDPCKKKAEKKEEPCKKEDDKKKNDPGKKEDDPCKNTAGKKDDKKVDPLKNKAEENKEDPCKKKDEKKKNGPCKKKEGTNKEDSSKKEVGKREDPCKKKDEKKKDDPCKKKGEKETEDPHKKREDEKSDPCKKKLEKKEVPCQKKDDKKDDPGKKKDNPCKNTAVKKDEKKEDPCKKKAEKEDNTEDPCKKIDEKKKDDPCKKNEKKKKEDPCKKGEEKKEDPCKKEDDPCKKKNPCGDKFIPNKSFVTDSILLFSVSQPAYKKGEEIRESCRDPCAPGACDVLPGQDEPCGSSVPWKMKVNPCRQRLSSSQRKRSSSATARILESKRKDFETTEAKKDSECGITQHPCGKKVCPNRCEVKKNRKLSSVQQAFDLGIINFMNFLAGQAVDILSLGVNFASQRSTSIIPPARRNQTGVAGNAPALGSVAQKVSGIMGKIKGFWNGQEESIPSKAKQLPKQTSEPVYTPGKSTPRYPTKLRSEGLSSNSHGNLDHLEEKPKVPALSTASAFIFIVPPKDDFEKCEDRVPPCPVDEPPPCPKQSEQCDENRERLWSDIDESYGYQKFPFKQEQSHGIPMEIVSQRMDDPFANHQL